MKATPFFCLWLFAIPVIGNAGAITSIGASMVDCPTINMIWTNANCNGFSDGTAEAQLLGGSGNFIYLWSTGDTTAAISGLPAGTHFVNVSDTTENCTVFGLVVIEEPEPLEIAPSSTPVKCAIASDGSAIANVSGGTAPYSFIWSNGLLTDTVLGLAPAIYTVTVSDSNGCSTFGSTTVGISNNYNLTFDNLQNVTCVGYTDGSMTAVVTGGSGSYNYLWNNNDTTATTDSLEVGTYIVSVSDTNGCSISDSTVMIVSNSYSLVFDSIQNVSCSSFANGSVSTLVNGGSGVYNYLWNNGDTTATIDSLIAGTYVLTVTDTIGCVTVDSLEIVEPLALSVTVLSQDLTSCFNTCDGSTTVQASGGTLPYSYLWDANTGSQTEPVAILLCPDTFIVSVTDDQGCVVLTSAIISAPDTIFVTDSISDALCAGSLDGSIFTEVFNSNGPLQYQWADTNYVISQTGADLLNVAAGTYFVQVTDSLGCITLDTFLIESPDPLQTELIPEEVSCFGFADGSIVQITSGGTVPYNFLWTDGDTLQDRTGIPVGNYIVLISDTNGCTLMDSTEIFGPEPLLSTAFINDVSCYQESNGSISLSTSGGNGGYQYVWNTGNNGDELSGLNGGIYSVSVTDALGCAFNDQYEVLISNEDCINVPSAFTPNSDGLNDDWVLRDINLYPGNSVKILNRWGQLVHESSEYTEPWDGRYNGEALPAGTYYYIVDLNDGKEALTGPVTLVR